MYLKVSTAYTFRLGPFVDSADGNTEENALTIAAASVLLSKAGGALTAKTEATALTGTGANAHYTCVLDTTDTNTVGTLRVWAHITGALAVYKDFMVLPANVYDSLVAGSDLLQTDETQLLGTAISAPATAGLHDVNVRQISTDATAADNCELMFDGTGYAGGTAKLKVDVETIKTQAVTCAAGVTVLASVGTAATSTAQTGDSFPLVSTEVAEIYAAVITNAAGTDIAADIIAMKVDTAAILIDTGTTLDGRIPAALGADGFIKASVFGMMGTALTETAGQIAAAFTKFFNKAFPTGTINSIPDAVAGAASGIAIVGSEMAANVTKVNGVAQTATLDTLKTVVDTIQADTDLLDDAIGGLADIHTDVAAVKSDTAAILLDTGTDGVVLPQAQADKVWGTAARILTANTNFNDPTAATIADAVWDELVTGHDGAGKAGAQLWTDIDAIAVDVAGLDGAAMRGTDSAALASVCTEGRLSELDAATGGKLANVADVIAVDVAGLDGAAMRGTDSAALASVCTEGRLAELDAANLPTTTDNILTDTGTTLDGRIPAALVGGRMDSNASAIAGVSAAATNLAASAGVIYIGSVTGATAATTLIDSALTQAATDFWIGRIVIFTSGTLKYQASAITAFDPATDKITFDAMTGAASLADTYVIV